MESERYNAQVEMLKRVRESSDKLGSLDQVRNSYGPDATLGDMTGSNNDISRLAARGSMDMDYFRIAMINYDGFIVSLRTDQHALADRKTVRLGQRMSGRVNLVGSWIT